MLPLAFIRYPNLNPEIVHISGPFGLRWYGLAYLLGFIFAYLLLIRMAKRGWMRIKPQLVGDLLTWLAFGVFIGGRAGWWLFYHRAPLPPQPPEPWYEPFAIWDGGMSFHGGLVGVLVAMYLWARKHRVSMANLADCAALVTPIGLFFGRLANFINHELYGRMTHVPWGVIFPVEGSKYPNFVYETFARHPSQLYEALLEGPLLLGILWLIFLKRRPRDGAIALAFVIFYSIFRFCVEFTREPDKQLGFIIDRRLAGILVQITMGQILSIAIALGGIAVWVIFVRRHRPEIPAEKAPAPSASDAAARKRPDRHRAGPEARG